MFDVVVTGASFEQALPSYIALLLKYAQFLYRQTNAVLLGFYTEDDAENAAVTIHQVLSEQDLKDASKRLYEYVRGRIRVYLKVLLPVEKNFKKVHVYFNMHFKDDQTSVNYSTLHPVNSVHDVAKVFFTIEDFEEWD